MKFRRFLFFFAFIFLLQSCGKNDTVLTDPSEGNRYPNAPSNPRPSNGAINVSHFGVTLSWTCSDPDANDTLRYDVRYGSTNNPTDTLVKNVLNTAADLGILDTNRTIFWKVTAKDNHGLSKEGPVWSFTTGH
ncbi:MAG: hypothetical protein K1X86_02790 [Ignavibacteria bacterium]|nr:hypothetical protein [Ignavibacteria bacterium]